jgi:hypothetical protein
MRCVYQACGDLVVDIKEVDQVGENGHFYPPCLYRGEIIRCLFHGHETGIVFVFRGLKTPLIQALG